MNSNYIPENSLKALEILADAIQPYKAIVEDINQNNMTSSLLGVAKTLNQYTIPFVRFQKTIDKIGAILEGISHIAPIYKTAHKLSDNQFVVVERISPEVVENIDFLDVNYLAENYLIDNNIVKNTIEACGLNGILLFKQATNAFYLGFYDIAILGFTAILDRTLSKCSGQMKNVNIKSRCDAIIDKVKDKGELYLDEIEKRDFLLFISYSKAMDLFGQDSDFLSVEPSLLNRHWIMHGRTNKHYSKLDCVKVLNMIYGTIRMSELGKEDSKIPDESDNS